MKGCLDALADPGPNATPGGHQQGPLGWSRGFGLEQLEAEPWTKAGEGWVCPGICGQAARWPRAAHSISPHFSFPCLYYQLVPTLQLSPSLSFFFFFHGASITMISS